MQKDYCDRKTRPISESATTSASKGVGMAR